MEIGLDNCSCPFFIYLGPGLNSMLLGFSQMVRHCAENTVEKDANRPRLSFGPRYHNDNGNSITNSELALECEKLSKM